MKIRYKAPNSDSSELIEYPINSADTLRSADAASADFRFAAAVSYFGHLLRKSSYSGNNTYADIAKLAESGKGPDKYGYRQEFINLVKNAAAVSR